MAETQPQFEQNQSESTGQSPLSGSTGGISLQFILERVKLVLTNPKNCWNQIKTEKHSITDIFQKYLVVMLAVPVVCEFIRMVTVGIDIPFIGTHKWSFFPGLVASVVRYIMSAVGIFVAAIIFEKFASKFQGSTDTTSTLKLLAYSATPALLAGVLQLVPMLGVLGILCGIYGLYILYQGIPVMTGVPVERRLPYFGVSFISVVVVGLLIGLISAVVSPISSDPLSRNLSTEERIELPGGVSVDVQKFQDSMKQFEKFMPADQSGR